MEYIAYVNNPNIMEILIPLTFTIAIQSVSTFIGASAAIALYCVAKRVLK